MRTSINWLDGTGWFLLEATFGEAEVVVAGVHVATAAPVALTTSMEVFVVPYLPVRRHALAVARDLDINASCRGKRPSNISYCAWLGDRWIGSGPLPAGRR